MASPDRSAPPWLDEREDRAWRGLVRMHAALLRHLHRDLQATSDLSLPDYEVLVHLSEAAEGRLRPHELGAALQWEKSRLSHHLRRMEARGLVGRQDCAEDGRGWHVVVTAAGRTAIAAAAPRHVAEIRRAFLDPLTPAQLDALAAVAAAVLDHLDPDDGC